MSDMLIVARYYIHKDEYIFELEPEDEVNPECKVFWLLPKEGNPTASEVYDIVTEIFKERKEVEAIWVQLSGLRISEMIERGTKKDEFFEQLLQEVRLCGDVKS